MLRSFLDYCGVDGLDGLGGWLRVGDDSGDLLGLLVALVVRSKLMGGYVVLVWAYPPVGCPKVILGGAAMLCSTAVVFLTVLAVFPAPTT